MINNLKYDSGNTIKLIFDPYDMEDGCFELLVVRDCECKQLLLVNKFTFEVEYRIPICKIPLEIETIAKINNENSTDILIDKYLNKKYPLNKFQYQII